MTPPDESLRRHVLALLDGRDAHLDLDAVVRHWPVALRGQVPEGLPHSPWQLLEHLRIAQWDLLGFTRDPAHTSPPWPEGYWPDDPAPPSPHAWDDALGALRADLEAMRDLVADPSLDLHARLPHGTGQTYLREALVAADHLAYHLGQLVLVRRLQGAWPPSP